MSIKQYFANSYNCKMEQQLIVETQKKEATKTVLYI